VHENKTGKSKNENAISGYIDENKSLTGNLRVFTVILELSTILPCGRAGRVLAKNADPSLSSGQALKVGATIATT
jgi:hypothetical protein